MNLNDVAKQLIIAVDGDATDKNISGVVTVFEGIKSGMNKIWQDHIEKETEETLLYAGITCACGRLLEINRTRQGVGYKGDVLIYKD